jgi:hypothetical protein
LNLVTNQFQDFAMRSIIFIAALLSAAAPALAQQSCEEHRNNRVIGTVAGAGIGGVLGNVIAGGGDKTLGTILGAVGGGVVGNQVSRGNGNCANAYGYYDKSGTWHPSNVAANTATGYYDRDSNWVEGAPRGYYDNQGRWVAAAGSTQVGYRDANDRWVAPAANDFDANNRYTVGATSGYWQNGRWIAGETTGSYDANGRWQPGRAAGRRDGNGNWVADAQPGHYDSRGRWVAGPVRGSYDARGMFIAENGYRDGNAGDRNDRYANSGYANNGYGNDRNQGDTRDIQSRFQRLESRIDRGINDGSLNRDDARRASAELDSIRRYDRSLRSRNGTISARNEGLVQSRLDRLSDRLRTVRGNG